MYAIARVGDTVSGTCGGNYTSGEHTRYESGTFTGEIISGSSITYDGDRPIARVGDIVRIRKNYSHGNHHDSTTLTTTIQDGSSILADQGKPVAYVGCKVSGSGFNGTIKTGSSRIFVAR